MTRWYGIVRGKRGGIGYFVATYPEAIPPNPIEVVESEESGSVCHELAQKMRDDALNSEATFQTPDPDAEDIVPGRVCIHDDGKKQHVSVVLTVDGEHATAVFLTSTPEWSNGFRGRRATKDELAMVAYKQTKPTYLVCCKRLLDGFVSQGMDVPPHWVDGWLKEFT